MSSDEKIQPGQLQPLVTIRQATALSLHAHSSGCRFCAGECGDSQDGPGAFVANHLTVRYKTKVGSFFNGYQLWSLFTVFATKVGSFLVFLCGEIGRLSPNSTAKEYVI